MYVCIFRNLKHHNYFSLIELQLFISLLHNSSRHWTFCASLLVKTGCLTCLLQINEYTQPRHEKLYSLPSCNCNINGLPLKIQVTSELLTFNVNPCSHNSA